ncbi:MAG TPA: Crp/Fnr family transcriptional regulator [Steroidobacteraceae bacterium]|nr:Crp/Fnr family transcriptional regulator [Steroidobacteraceae bacterium]
MIKKIPADSPSRRRAPRPNELLARLSRDDRRRLLRNDKPLELAFGHVLCEPGERLHYVYFPVDSIISLVTAIDGHAGLEVGLVGNEGMYGVPLALGVDVSPLKGLVQGSGTAWRVDALRLRRQLQRSASLRNVLHRYAEVLMIQLSMEAACTRFHVVETRLARWLLMTADRAHADAFHITHQFLSYMLGVRRVGVTRAATALRRRKLIRYHRGNISIIDRAGLEAASCTCYATAKREYKRTMNGMRPRTGTVSRGRGAVRARTSAKQLG